MIKKIESRREELVAAHGKTKEEIAQLEQRLVQLRSSLHQIVGAVAALNELHPPTSDLSTNGQAVEEELEEEPA